MNILMQGCFVHPLPTHSFLLSLCQGPVLEIWPPVPAHTRIPRQHSRVSHRHRDQHAAHRVQHPHALALTTRQPRCPRPASLEASFSAMNMPGSSSLPGPLIKFKTDDYTTTVWKYLLERLKNERQKRNHRNARKPTNCYHILPLVPPNYDNAKNKEENWKLQLEASL